MKKMTLTLALLSVISFRAAAQDVFWSDLALGDRVEITFRSGNTLGGMLVAPDAKVKSLDYAKEPALTLDVTWEYPGLNGTVTVLKKEIKSVRKMRVIDEKTRLSLEEMKQRIAAENAKQRPEPKVVTPAPAPTPDAKPETKPEDEAAAKAEELKKAMEFYAKYPSPFWGPERHTLNVQKKARGQAWSQAETEFEQDYEKLWEKGRAASVPKKL